MPRSTRRHLPGLEVCVIGVVIAAATAIGVFVQDTTTRVRESLPGQVLEQQRDISYMVHDLSDLVRAAELARLDPSAARRDRVIARLHETMGRLREIRQSYNFDNLIGASAMHAVVNPALQDMDRWLHEGVQGHPPDSTVVLRLVQVRAEEAYRRVRALFDESNTKAVQLIGAEAQRLERFRDGLVVYLVVFALFAIGVVVLFVRQRNAEARLALERKRLTDSIESLNEGFALFDTDERLIICNQRYRDMYPTASDITRPGVAFRELVQRTAGAGAVAALGSQTADLVEARVRRFRDPQGPFELDMKDGRCLQVCEYRTREGGRVCIHSDITSLKRTQARLEHLATHDALTELPNRAVFEDRLAHAVAQSGRRRSQVALMLFDLDRFKLVNDTLGHAGGDMVLRSVAATLQRCLRSADTVARLGGDEFAAIVENVRSWKEVTVLAERALAALAEGRGISGCEVFPTASIGIALHPEDGASIPELIRNADAACYHAKALGRNRYKFFTAELNASLAERVELEKRLRHAVEHGEMAVSYQPQMEIASRRITGMEALVRWDARDLGPVSPARFIPVAEELGLIGSIGEWMLHEACLQCRHWRERGTGELRVCVNISSRQWVNTNLGGLVQQVLKETGLPPEALTLEVTERALMNDMEAALDALHRLHGMGVHLVIDDFGVGYSSLAVLKQYPLDGLKIDGSFVQGITSNSDDLEIVSAVIAMAHNLRLRVVAEGTETRQQLELLGARGCDEAQGYIVSEPLPADEATRFLEKGTAAARVARA